MKTALLVYANGTEDIEITAPADVLSRGGVKVTRAAVTASGNEVTLAHGTVVKCDKNLNDCTGPYDLIVVPGGLPGAEYCRDSPKLIALLKEQQQQGRLIGSICASPGFVLATHGIITTQSATGYPGCCDNIQNYTGAGVQLSEDGKIITGKGPGFALQFALTLLKSLCGKEVAQKVAAGMLTALD
ncbi:MAG: DJ-1/PfpI family protein [Succinivibrio sp.]|nr:DJ-1/PfpI family protein [Succinivibrio sp.]